MVNDEIQLKNIKLTKKGAGYAFYIPLAYITQEILTPGDTYTLVIKKSKDSKESTKPNQEVAE